MSAKFKTGDRVRILYGNLRGSYGEIASVDTDKGQTIFGVKTTKIDWPLFYYEDELQLSPQ